MKRPAIHNAFRIAFIGFGIGCLIFGCIKLSTWIGYAKADGMVELFKTENSKAGTNAFLIVSFTRPSGAQGSFYENVPANAKPGDHVSVLYRPGVMYGQTGDGVVYTFSTVWRTPLVAGIIGVASMMLGFYFRRRIGGLFSM